MGPKLMEIWKIIYPICPGTSRLVGACREAINYEHQAKHMLDQFLLKNHKESSKETSSTVKFSKINHYY
jgi:hypothetical protein